MNAVCRYILCVICTVMLCGSIRVFFHDNNTIIKMLTGLGVMIVSLTPILSGQQLSLCMGSEDILADCDAVVSSGLSAAREETYAFIKEKTQSYVLNRASELGASVSVDVVLSDDDLPIPMEITLCGVVSPYVKMRLQECICNDVGIAEDDQIWIS